MKGLTAGEVAERIAKGQVNRSPRSGWREYGPIVARNLFTWFNAMVTPAAVALFLLREFQGALAVSGMAIVNTVLGLTQEIRAKRHLDKLAILVETKARVLRDGQTQEISAGDVVLGEHILLTGGEAVVADGPVLDANFLEVDEALLTGESDPIRRQAGEKLLSGSYCVAGDGMYRADKVGPESFAQQTSSQARRYQHSTSPLTQVINRIVQTLSYIAIALTILFTVAFVLQGFPKTPEERPAFNRREHDYVRMVAATITSLVPQGLVLTATMAFTLGAIVMSRRGAIVQRLSAVETMASIDVICTDKTGTLTTNHLHLEQILIVGDSLRESPNPDSPALVAPTSLNPLEAAVRDKVRLFAAASMDQKNRNIQALRQALDPQHAPVISKSTQVLLEQIPFKSQNRYSALHIKDERGSQTLVLGALEALRDRIGLWESQHPDQKCLESLAKLAEERQNKGQRLLLFGELAGDTSLANLTELPRAPVQPLAILCLVDELRDEASGVLAALAAQGIAFKVISGDNPETVRGTLANIDLPLAHDPVVTGAELAESTDKAALIEKRSVFGRVAPQQKVEIVESLQKGGHRVAMIGDGVNDVLPIKKADLGIAMGEGSQASKTVSGLVLQNNNFALLPETLEEGRTIVRNLRRSAKLFLVKNVYSLILILAYFSGWFGIPFPYVPQQVTLLNWLVIGAPAIVIAMSRERSTAATKGSFLREVGWFAGRTGVVFGLAGIAILLLARGAMADRHLQRTMLLSVLILLGITALLRALKDGETETLQSDTRFRLLGALAIPLYLAVMYWPAVAGFFELTPLDVPDWGLVLIVVLVAYALTLLTDQWRREPASNVAP